MGILIQIYLSDRILHCPLIESELNLGDINFEKVNATTLIRILEQSSSQQVLIKQSPECVQFFVSSQANNSCNCYILDSNNFLQVVAYSNSIRIEDWLLRHEYEYEPILTKSHNWSMEGF